MGIYDTYDTAVACLKRVAQRVARTEFEEMYSEGLLEQELDSIENHIEYMVSEYLCDGDGHLLEDAEDIWNDYRDVLIGDVEEMVESAAETVSDFLEECKEG